MFDQISKVLRDVARTFKGGGSPADTNNYDRFDTFRVKYYGGLAKRRDVNAT